MQDPVERVAIPSERIARWFQAAELLGDLGVSLQAELVDLARDLTRHRLRRAARAARAAEQASTRELQMIANATATEMEDLAEAPSGPFDDD